MLLEDSLHADTFPSLTTTQCPNPCSAGVKRGRIMICLSAPKKNEHASAPPVDLCRRRRRRADGVGVDAKIMINVRHLLGIMLVAEATT